MRRDPRRWIPGGYDVHVVYFAHQADAARALFADLLAWAEAASIPHERPLDFPSPVGPWPTSMWQILLRNPDPAGLEQDLGRCVGWLMINRGELSVMIHPNTAAGTGADVGFGGGLRDHSRYPLWMGPPLPLRLEIFEP